MLLAVGAAAFIGVLLSADQAQARWGRWGSSGSSGGSWGSSGSSGGSWGSSGSSGGSWGSSGSSGGSWGGGYYHRTPVRTALRVILPPYGHRRYYRSWGSSGSSGGSWGSSGSSGGSWGSSGSSGGSWGSSGYIVPMDEDDATPVPPQPVPPQPQGDGNPPLPGAPGAQPMTSFGEPDAVLINVSLPEGAKLLVNGNATRSQGTDRTFISRGLEAGKRYKYELRAEGEKDGRPVSETKVVYVTAGDQTSLVFGMNSTDSAENIAIGETDEAPAAKPVSTGKSTEDKTTTLRLHVPADAKVTLSGVATKSTGPVRVFSTAKLADGQTWDNYVVRAELTQNGQTVTKEATITLNAGETRDLTLEFDSQPVVVASTR